MNNKIEILFNRHIKRLEKDVAETQSRINKQGLDKKRGMEAICIKDDLKKIALLHEGVLPKYSDLPAGQVTGLNGLPEVVISEFTDLQELVDETGHATRDLDLIDYGKRLK